MTPSTTTYNQGDIVLVPFPFADQDTNKKRPALIISAPWYHQRDNAVILVAITSSIPNVLDPDDLLLDNEDLRFSGLYKESIIKSSWVYRLDANRIIKKFGALRHKTVEAVIQRLLSVCAQT